MRPGKPTGPCKRPRGCHTPWTALSSDHPYPGLAHPDLPEGRVVPLVPEPPADLVHPGRDSVWARGLRLTPSKTPLQAAIPASCTHRAQGDIPQLQLARASGTQAAPHGHGKILPAAPNSRQGRGSRAVLQSPAVLAAPVPPRAPSSRVAPLCRVVPGDRRTDRAEASTPQDPASPLWGGGSGPVPGW